MRYFAAFGVERAGGAAPLGPLALTPRDILKLAKRGRVKRSGRGAR